LPIVDAASGDDPDVRAVAAWIGVDDAAKLPAALDDRRSHPDRS
jgi:hypothetical protein